MPAEIDEPGITSRASQFEDRPGVGMVVAVGEDVDNVAVGNVIYFGPYSHVQLTHDDLIFLLMRSEDIYCVAE